MMYQVPNLDNKKKENKMENKKQNNNVMMPKYFKLDIRNDKTINVTNHKNPIQECDMVIVRKNSVFDSLEDQILIEKEYKETRSWLKKEFPSGDWYYKVSNNHNNVFWKRKALLRQRQNQMQIPFKQAA